MSRGQNPLMLMMALSLPGAAQAIGLGEIHVDSGLNEPLAAEIDIVGATAADLVSLRASVASRETFLHLGADRPAFLTSTTFKIAEDSRGRPVLAIRSSESFTEPLVNMVVDLRWQSGELIRQYTLLLDPVGFPSSLRATARPVPAAPATTPTLTPTAAALTVPATVAALDVPAAPAALDVPATPAAAALPDVAAAVATARKTTHIKVGAKATLRGVAWRVGARSDADLQKTMLAIFRANPSAFDGNINRLRLGALLTIPSAAACAAIPRAEAAREIHAQMAAWHSAASLARGAPALPNTRAPATAPAESAPVPAQPAPAANSRPVEPPAAAASSEEEAALDARVHSLEQGLHDMQGQLETEHNRLLGVQAQLRYAERAAPAAPAAVVVKPDHGLAATIAAGAGLLLGACALLYRRARRGKSGITADLDVPATEAPVEPVSYEPAPAPRDALREPAAQEPARRAPHHAVERAVSPEVREAAQALDSDIAQHSSEATAGLDAAKLREEQAAAKLREEIAAAWALPEAFHEATGTFPPATLGSEPSEATQPFPVMQHAGQDDTLNMAGDTEVLPAATVNMAGAPILERGTIDTTNLDYNLVDLDMTAQHVHMPSDLHENAIVKERRTTLIDVLKTAIEREPDRRDLRMKLLETYYAAAATNRQGFLDEVQKLARERDYMGDGEWDKIAYMGRQIAADTGLFATEPADHDKIADCA
jgi:pilus assembly protein FimV